jgi:hypothetical protein
METEPHLDYLTIKEFSRFSFTPKPSDVGKLKVYVKTQYGERSWKSALTVETTPSKNCVPTKIL